MSSILACICICCSLVRAKPTRQICSVMDDTLEKGLRIRWAIIFFSPSLCWTELDSKLERYLIRFRAFPELYDVRLGKFALTHRSVAFWMPCCDRGKMPALVKIENGWKTITSKTTREKKKSRKGREIEATLKANAACIQKNQNRLQTLWDWLRQSWNEQSALGSGISSPTTQELKCPAWKQNQNGKIPDTTKKYPKIGSPHDKEKKQKLLSLRLR